MAALVELLQSTRSVARRPGLVLSSSPTPPRRAPGNAGRATLASLRYDLDTLAHGALSAVLAHSRTLPGMTDWPLLLPLLDAINVGTQSFQVWLDADEDSLGWPYGDTVVAGGGKPFDTYAPMSHLIERESWPAARKPRALGYFCSVLPDEAGRGSQEDANDAVRRSAVHYLESRSATHWPAARRGHGFDWLRLVDAGSGPSMPPLAGQFCVANVHGSDRYVQATPESDPYRLAPGESGCENLVLAGDWTDSRLNAGCIEAAVLSGLQAANRVLERSREHRVLGGWVDEPRPVANHAR